MKKISVIVPVYNVEKYLSKCITTIVNQTYKNLEIILVDDGSTDGSGALCDDLALTDSRISVIHKENGGLSDARNAGLDASTGDYIGFVDSDDYIDSDFYELLVKTLEENDADVSCCRYTRVWENGRTEQVGNDGSVEIFNGTEALGAYLYGKTMDPFAWNKLYKAELLGNQKYTEKKFRFIKGILSEDNPFCIELFKTTKRVVIVGASKYNYLQARDGAITNSKVSQKKIESVFRWEEYRTEIKQKYPQLDKYVLRREMLFVIGLYNRVYNEKQYSDVLNRLKNIIKNNLYEVLHSDVCEKSIKASSFLITKAPFVYLIVMKAYKIIAGEARL